MKEHWERRLLEASEAGEVEAAREIMRAAPPPFDLNCRDEFGETPLILAARNGYHELVEFLLNKGADVSVTNPSGDDALIAASEHPENTIVLNVLLEGGADTETRNNMGRTALVVAASIGDLPNVLLLLRHHPNLEAASEEEETALTFAVVNEYAEVAKVLVAAGADVNWTDSKGWTPLIYAVYSGNVEIARLLIDAGADPHHSDVAGDTVLIHAVRSGSAAIVHEVLAHAPDTGHRGSDRLTALDHAERNGTEEISRLLRQSE